MLFIALVPFVVWLSSACEVQVPTLALEPQQYEGAWFVVARKTSASRSFLPSNVTSSLIRLDISGDQLNMAEYHSVDLQCRPPLTGIWRKESMGFVMELRTEAGQLFTMPIRAIYHGYSGEQNEEMNMVLYGCQQPDSKGNCQLGEELVMIMSNSRHPQTQQLFNSAKLIEDSACIDILHFKILETYTACGDEIVDEDQKLIHASIDENNEFVDVECKVANFRFSPNNASSFFDEPRVLTVIAYIDPFLSAEQIAHISCSYDSTSVRCQWLRRNTCFSTDLTQTIDGSKLSAVSTFPTLNGSSAEIDWSGQIIWESGDEYISMRCVVIDDDGGCDDYRIYVWSDEDHMDQPTIHEIRRQLQAICVDPTDLVYLNTFHECMDSREPPDRSAPICSGQPGWIPISPAILQGVWYFAADLNAEPKIFLQSAVITLTPNETDHWQMHLQYYAQKEADSECVGPGKGLALLSNDSTLDVTVEYSYSLVPNHRNTIRFRYKLLYADNQRAVLYWCFKTDKNGTCTQHDLSVMIRSRHFSHHDLNMILPSLEGVCIDKDNLRWFDLHSPCGAEMSASTRLRRDLVTLSHYDVLNILTDVQEPRCLVHQMRGMKADFLAMEKAGPWFLMARYDEMALDTYSMVGRVFAASETSAVLRLLQSAALPGEPLDCYTRVFTMKEMQNGSDYFYELHYEASTGNSTTMIFRMLFFNRHVAVAYSCLAYKEDGSCDEKAIYVISRHKSIDHAELTVLETVARAVCIDPVVLYHTGVHDDCVYAYSSLKPPTCSLVEESAACAEWERISPGKISALYGDVIYHAVASSRPYPNPFSLRFNGSIIEKITEDAGNCSVEPVEVEFTSTNRLLARLETGEVALLHPAASPAEVLLKEAQLTGFLPCMHQINRNNNETMCQAMKKPECSATGPLKVAEELDGEWTLYAADPTYVMNQRCTVNQDGESGGHIFVCSSESWFGECEREARFSLTVDAWGGFLLQPLGSPLRIPAELFTAGNISVTAERIIMLRDGDLVGRRYSIWLRSGTSWCNDLANDAATFCIWPTAPQIKNMENLCA